MFITVHGVNHKTAPVAVRERVAFANEELPDALSDLRESQGIGEALILSTCNRTEIYCCLQATDHPGPASWLAKNRALPERELSPYLYALPNESAVRHAMRVASGLDSLVLGEPQILGQIKDAYSIANRAGSLGMHLSRLFEHSFHVAKKVRTDTAIGADPISIAYAAVRLAQQIFGDLGNRRALLVGAGQTVALAARHLAANGIGGLIIANRTVERAARLAAHHPNAEVVALDGLARVLPTVDVVITATGSRTPLITRALVEQAMKVRRHRPMFLVDIAVPRDVEPAVGGLEDIYLYTLDDLEEVVRDNLKARQAAATEADEIVRREVQCFNNWLTSLDATTTIRAVRAGAHTAREEILGRALRRLQRGDAPEPVLRYLAETLTNRLLHHPTTRIRESLAEGRADLLALARELYGLDDEEEP